MSPAKNEYMKNCKEHEAVKLHAPQLVKNMVFLENDEIPYLAPSDEGAVSEAD